MNTRPIYIYSIQIIKTYKPIKTKTMTLLITPSILMSNKKQGWTVRNKIIAFIWIATIDICVAKVSGLL
jgi:hypothetical protein